MIRVLLAEDSPVTREHLVRLLQTDAGITVAGVARDGVEAVEQAQRLRPDIILMDARMPRMDGYEATREIMARTPTPIIIISASFDPADANLSFAALEAGALTILGKPSAADSHRRAESAQAFIQRVKLMTEVKVVRRWPKLVPPPRPQYPHASPRSVHLVAIGASTGGPPAVAEVLRQIPKRPPILVVQHIAAGFIRGFAQWLHLETGFPAKLAEQDEQVRPGTVYVAPEGTHMELTRHDRILLVHGPEHEGFRPSISHLFRAAAETHGHSAAGVLLSGMGRDGAAGLRALCAAGAPTFAQDEASCVVFGMPQEAIRLGAAQYVLPPTEIGRTLRALLAEDTGEWP